ncbi:lonely Cys domain-containing protein, partial [Streptomyces sp. WG7]|uniref:lonely Cys domain-containing protein n=1 Tax=Streptomyces sp. WG7 TaxID=3417650 RepID=UPI003CFB6384
MRLLHETFGVQWGDGRFGEYLAGLGVLEAVRAADAELSWELLDTGVLEKMARRVLRLPDDHPVGVGDLWMLYDVAQEAWAAGRAGSVVAVAAFYLDRHLGVLSGPGRVATPDGWVPGRNWLRPPVPFDPDHGGYAGGRREVMKWAGQRPYVLLASGSSGGVWVVDRARVSHWLGAEELAELLKHDPVMPTDGPVVFFVSRAGQGGLELPRLVADRLAMGPGGRNRVVWATDGDLVFETSSQTGFDRLVLDDSRRGEAPVGKWIPSRPGYVLRGAGSGFFRTVDGQVISDRHVAWHAILDKDGTRIIGRSSMSPQDTAQYDHPVLSSLEGWARGYGDLSGSSHAFDGPKVGYWVLTHGDRQAVDLWLDDGTLVRVNYVELGRVLRRRPSFQKLRADQAVQLHVCHAGSLAPGRDRLVVPRNGQMVANAVGRVVRAAPASVNIRTSPDGDFPVLELSNPVDVPEVFPRLFFPEPSGDELWDRIDQYLVGPDGALPPEPEERMLRMMRAVNEIFGVDPVSEPQLLEAFGRLERMRLADQDRAGWRGGPLTWELLEEIAGQYAVRQEAWKRSGAPSGWPLLAVMREMLGKALDPWARNPMTLTWFLDNSSEVAAVRLPRALDPAFWDDGNPDNWTRLVPSSEDTGQPELSGESDSAGDEESEYSEQSDYSEIGWDSSSDEGEPFSLDTDEVPGFQPSGAPPGDVPGSSALKGARVPEFVSVSESPVGREGWWS